MDSITNLKYGSDGLIPAVIQDAENGQVLMVGYMDAEAVRRTHSTGRVTFFSRSRQKYWVKGETSGHFQNVVEILTDCDQDCLLVKVHQIGAACHEGYRSCFFRRMGDDSEKLEVVAERLMDPADIYGKS